jgi:monoamine oxidase
MQVTEQFDVIVIGAGAAGLLCAHDLTRVKMKILILESQARVGGRMYTNLPERFTRPIESGAEFIHGEAPITLGLLTQSGSKYHEMSGNVYQAHDDTVRKEDFFDNEWSLVLDGLKKLEKDMTMADFLRSNFANKEHHALKEKITRFVEGYNAADITKVSALALRDEWSAEEDPAQYRIQGGYAQLYNFLRESIESAGGVITLNQTAQEVRWRKGHVEVSTQGGTFFGNRCVTTIPISHLKSDAVTFTPAVPAVSVAAGKIGFGGVIKIHLEFKRAFWETDTKRKLKNIQFLFTDEFIPTWWSQSPDPYPLLTGWLGGPRAEQLSKTHQQLFTDAIASLAKAMDFPEGQIKDEVVAFHVNQWLPKDFSKGAYSYEMVGSSEAIAFLQQPIENTLYFAGEAIYRGPHKGTVEAALESGRKVAMRITAKIYFFDKT